MPFLRLKQRLLQEQLASVESDLQLCHADMERKTSSASSYEEYLRQYNARKRYNNLFCNVRLCFLVLEWSVLTSFSVMEFMTCVY